MSVARIIFALAIMLGALTVELRIFTATGAAPDLALAALLAFAAAGGIAELSFAAVLAVAGLNWQPAMSAEMFWLIALPFAATFLVRILPLRRWAANVTLVGGGLALFPFLVAPEFVVRAPDMFIASVMTGLAFGAALFLLLDMTGPFFGRPAEPGA